MADLPILFSAPMVRAILREIEQPGSGKTQTRRVLSNSKPASLFNGQWADSYVLDPGNQSWRDSEIRYAVGDQLWVREAWAPLEALTHSDPGVTALANRGFYRADDGTVDGEISRWRSSIHMPRWASRITLIVTEVRVERLQDITEADAKAEGVDCDSDGWRDYQMSTTQCCTNARDSFRTLWDSLNGDRPGCAWSDNPWIAAYTFRPILGNIDQIGRATA